jgi:predicted MFS family arabinose efflux permease
VLTVAGTFTVYTYLGAFLASVTGFGSPALALVLLGFGIASALGSRLGGIAADRVGARLTVALCGGLAFVDYVVLWRGAAFEPRGAIIIVPAIFLWGLASWAVMTAQQARLVALRPALAPVSLSLNSSAMYLGSAIGSAAGAGIMADRAVPQLALVAAAFSLAALIPVIAAGDKLEAGP